MKKIFTLLAAVFCMINVANAQTYECWQKTKTAGDVVQTPENSTFFTVSSKTADGKYPVSYEGKDYAVSIKMEAASTISFTPTKNCTLTVVACGVSYNSKDGVTSDNTANLSIKLNDQSYSNFVKSEAVSDVNAYILAVPNLEPNITYTITRGKKEFGIVYVKVVYDESNEAPISWSENSTTIQLGSEYTLPTFSNTDPEIAVSFVSSNPEVATVSESGEISLVENGVGTAVITATYEGEKYDKTEVSCEITVVSTVDPEFAFSAAEVTVNFGGDMSSLPTLVMSEDIAASDVTYSVTPAGIAEVKDGIINVLAAGKATITATFAGNDKYSSATATCVVTALPQKEIKVGEVILAIGAIGDDVDSGKKDNEGNVIYKSIVAAGTNIFDDANITVTNVSATLRANDSKNICGADMTNYIQIRNEKEDNTELTITPKANMEFVVYGRLQDKSADQPVIQNTKNFTLNESGSALKSTMHFSEWLVGGAEKPYEYFLMGQSFTLEAGKTYTLTAGGFGFRLYGFSYTAEAPAEIAAPTHNQEGETVKVNGSQEVVFTPAAEHHVVYTCFEAATAPEVETQAAAETVEHEGKTFTLAADNKVTVDKSGTLHYFAMDPETKATSPVNTIAFDVTTGIADIDVDSENAPVEYFNMQGIRVANPQNGLYIRRQGNKVEKVYVK